jgi:hypothetical protein
MQRFAAVASVALLPFLALVAPAHAQAVDCPSTAGAAASLEQFPSGLFEIYTAVNSASISQSFMLKDSQGHGLRDVDLEVVLPDSPAELVFQTGFRWTLPSPKRVMVKTLGNCGAGIPNIIGGPEAGSFAATVRVVGSETTFTIPIHVINTQAYVRREFPSGFPSGAIVWPVDSPLIAGYQPNASAEWSDGMGHFGPLGGVAMTFMAPSTGPTLEFTNGAQQITLATGAAGGASAPARTVGGPGSILVRAMYPDGTLANAFRYVALGPPEVRFVAPFSIEYGASQGMQARARYVGVPCDLNFLNSAGPRVSVTSNGVRMRASGLSSLQGTRPCPSDVFEAPFTFWVQGLPLRRRPNGQIDGRCERVAREDRGRGDGPRQYSTGRFGSRLFVGQWQVQRECRAGRGSLRAGFPSEPS